MCMALITDKVCGLTDALSVKGCSGRPYTGYSVAFLSQEEAHGVFFFQAEPASVDHM